MTIALLLALDETARDVDQLLAFHRAAGVDVVVAAGADARTRSRATSDEGFLRRAGADASPTDLARFAVDELGADWLIPGSPDELWWPRGENLKDVLAVIPPRYGVVQALVRTFVGESSAQHDDRSAFESRTVRTSLLGPDGSGGGSASRSPAPRVPGRAEHDARRRRLDARRAARPAACLVSDRGLPLPGGGRRARARSRSTPDSPTGRSSSTSERVMHSRATSPRSRCRASSTTARTRSNAPRWVRSTSCGSTVRSAISSCGSPSSRRGSGRGCGGR